MLVNLVYLIKFLEKNIVEILFKKTDLESRFSLNMNVLIDGKVPNPQKNPNRFSENPFKSNELFNEIYAFYEASIFRILPDTPDILFDASCIRMGNPVPLEDQ